MTNILILEKFGPICVASDDGAALNTALREALERGEDVTLDFSGVKTLASVFLNASLGELYSSYPAARLDNSVRCIGLSPANESVVRLVRRNAVKFYGAKPPEQDALAAAGELGDN